MQSAFLKSQGTTVHPAAASHQGMDRQRAAWVSVETWPVRPQHGKHAGKYSCVVVSRNGVHAAEMQGTTANSTSQGSGSS